MGLQLTKIDDPRDPLERARLRELVNFAKANGQTDINDQMPAILIRRILRQRNLTRISVPRRTLGQPEPSPGRADLQPRPSPVAETGGAEISAEDDLARQFAASRPRSVHDMGYNELRAEAKRRKIKLNRSDTLAIIKEKLGVQNPP